MLALAATGAVVPAAAAGATGQPVVGAAPAAAPADSAARADAGLPARSDPAQSDPARSELARSELARSELALRDPARWDFESGTPGSVPAGCAAPAGKAPAVITAADAASGRQSLLIDDQNASAQTVLGCSFSARAGAQLALSIKPTAVRGGIAIDLTGTSTAGAGGIFHLIVVGDGAVRWYDERGGWRPLAPAGTVPTGVWSRLELGVTGDQDAVYLSVNGSYRGSAGPQTINPVRTLTGWQVASSGTATVGDTAYLDDVTVGPALARRPNAITAQYAIGPKYYLATSSTPAQMPTTAVQVPWPTAVGGKRIIASFPAHGDSATDTGNRMVISDDGGKTWQDYQSHNPMPQVPSIFITRLQDGSLYAMNYHNYATADPTRATIESATSTDNGVTWTQRDGTLTSPEPLAAYACERPAGCTAIVQVHSVVEDPDGTLYQTAYGRYQGDTKLRQILLVSKNKGLDWTVRATVANNPNLSTDKAFEGFPEGVLTRIGEHGFLMVMRTGSYLPMYQSYSSDDGYTWSTPQPVRTTTGQPVSSVFPTLERMADGSLLLLVGRPGLSLLRSRDDGKTWTPQTWVDYQNSANGFMMVTGSKTVMVFGDQGADWNRPLQYRVWSRTVIVHGR
ncbi:sialidase family protein [Nakamurella aerolata]|uniref:sialidase family protein n=1 Tax=Nakamurella aerolata TaxID=1656892 RepID=UPI001BB2AA67